MIGCGGYGGADDDNARSGSPLIWISVATLNSDNSSSFNLDQKSQ
jgi:hypothetical protein